MDLGISGRTALVTGASKGIGRAIAARLFDEGCTVWIVSRTEADLARAAAQIGAADPARIRFLPADLADEGERQRVVARVGDVDILVNNAGGIPGGNILEFDDASWQAAWQLKVFGYVSMCRQYYARMKARGGGVIVNVVGNAADALDFDYICGSTANAGLCAFTRALGGASHRDGIRVVGVNPGPVETERLEALMRKKAAQRTGSAENWQTLKAPLPFGRAATPDEIAATVVLLASDLSGYTTGTVVTIDGGIVSRSQTF